MKILSPMARMRLKKRGKGWLPYEVWVHNTHSTTLQKFVKVWQKLDDTDMNITALYANLTPDQSRFERDLSAYPYLYGFWDFHTCRCDVPGLTKAIGPMSSGEQVLARFFMAVWQNDDSQVVSVAEASTLDDTERLLIAGWIAKPYYP